MLPSDLSPYSAPAVTLSPMGAAEDTMPDFLNVVVTGGSSGIGAAMVRVFAEAGHRVLFTFLTGRKHAEKLEAGWRDVTKVQLDQGDVASVAEFSTVVEAWAGQRGVDVLVNNAALGSATVKRYVERTAHAGATTNGTVTRAVSRGIINGVAGDHTDGIEVDILDERPNGAVTKDVREADLSGSAVRMLRRAAHDEALLRVNSLGPLWVTQAVSDAVNRAAVRRRAVVIFIGSVGGGSAAVFPEYCPADLMSKAAMTYLSKHLAAEHVRDNVDVLCVSPGATETEMFRKSTLSKVADVPGFVDSMPKRRLLQPEDVARSVFWLATQSPPGIFHGAVLDASMGLAVRPGLQTETNGNR